LSTEVGNIMNRLNKIILLVLISKSIAYSQSFNADLIKYTGAIFKQAATGEIQVFDSLMKKLPADTLYSRFISAKPSMADNINNNFYTKNTFKEASFINAFHYGLFEGSMGLPDLPAFLFDTLIYKQNPNYIVFRLYRYNDDGSFKDKKKLFIVNRKATVTNKQAIINKSIKLAADSQNRQETKMLVTKENECWAISELYQNNKKSEPDLCKTRYRMQLTADMHFKQYYADTSDFNINKKAGIDSSIERAYYFLKDKEHVQCYIENETGIWRIAGNQLLLMTFDGIIVNNYKIIALTGNRMDLQIKNYKIRYLKNHF
jgi:hypothetical protein